jgi:hypothetical protein
MYDKKVAGTISINLGQKQPIFSAFLSSHFLYIIEEDKEQQCVDEQT